MCSRDTESVEERGMELSESGSVCSSLASKPENEEMVHIVGPGVACQLGHQVVPVGDQALDAKLNKGKQSRPARLRAEKDKAGVKFDGPAPRYLHTHLDFIYYSCMVPYKRESDRDGQRNTETRFCLSLMLHSVQKVKCILLLDIPYTFVGTAWSYRNLVA